MDKSPEDAHKQTPTNHSGIGTQHTCPACDCAGFEREDSLWNHLRKEHPERSPAVQKDAAAWKAKASENSISAAGRRILPTHNALKTRTPLSREPSVDSMRMHVEDLSRSQTPQQSGQPDASTVQLARLSLEQNQLSSPMSLISPSKKRSADAGAPPIEIEESRIRHSPVCRTWSRPGPQACRDYSSTQSPDARCIPRNRHSPDTSNDNVLSAPNRPKQPPKVGALPDSNAKIPDMPPVEPSKTPSNMKSSRFTCLASSQTWPRASEPQMLMELPSRPISSEELEIEVVGLESELVAVEKKCMAIDQAQMTPEARQRPLTNEHWQVLTAMHRSLLYQHHDYFLASQHPKASPTLRRVAADKHMPLRMWKYAIHAHLEVLRLHLPQSIDFMVNFIYLSYQMMALLYETVEEFKNVWTECLGDLARYRMAIENRDARDREVWAGVSRYWYAKGSDNQPTIGRLYHHLGILAKPNALQQLYFYSKSLTSIVPFRNTKESIRSVFDPALGRSPLTAQYASKFDALFVKAHALIFDGQNLEAALAARAELDHHILEQIALAGPKWKEHGVFVVVTCVSAWFGYGSEKSVFGGFYGLLEKALPESETDAGAGLPPDPWLALVVDLTFGIFRITLTRLKDRNTLPHVHLMLTFIASLCRLTESVHSRDIAVYCIQRVPWAELTAYLNKLAELEGVDGRTTKAGLSLSFLQPERGDARPLPEDYLIRGLAWCRDYFPLGWFEKTIDEESRLLELASTHTIRAQRVLYLAICVSEAESNTHALGPAHAGISQMNRSLTYNDISKTFSTFAEPLPSEDTVPETGGLVDESTMDARADIVHVDCAQNLPSNTNGRNGIETESTGTKICARKRASPPRTQGRRGRKSNEHNEVRIADPERLEESVEDV